LKIDANPRICFLSSVLINQEALREQYPHEYVGETYALNCGSKSNGYCMIYSTASEIVILSAIFFTNGVIIIVIGRPIANVVKNIPNHISKKL
jgi:hypothetical protein